MPILGPIAPYSNVPIAPQNFNPSQFPITDITLGQTTTVTMGDSTNGVSPNYVIGQLIRLLIPPEFGSRQLNGQQGYVLSLPSATSVEVSIDSSNADPFILASTNTVAQIVAIGDVGNGLIVSTGRISPTTTIPGSFINVSP